MTSDERSTSLADCGFVHFLNKGRQNAADKYYLDTFVVEAG